MKNEKIPWIPSNLSLYRLANLTIPIVPCKFPASLDLRNVAYQAGLKSRRDSTSGFGIDGSETRSKCNHSWNHVPGGLGLAAASHLGFLTILQDQQGYTGGYLVTNGWGRPLEFRITSPIMPNKVQQLLYGATLRPYVCSELIGKTLIEKTSTPADLIITDHEAAQELRELVSGPLVWFASQEQLNNQGKCENRIVAQGTSGALLVHPKHLGDISPIKNILLQTEIIDLSEPFSRVREALTEVRKLNNFKAA